MKLVYKLTIQHTSDNATTRVTIRFAPLLVLVAALLVWFF